MRILSAFGANPYRRREGAATLLRAGLHYLAGSAELAAVLLVPAYRRHIRRKVSKPVSLMVVGAQKAGTTWVHAQLRQKGLAAVSPLKECHHFDRGRMGSLRGYLAQFDGLPDLPIVEVAPDYGPMAPWRLRAIRAIFPDLRVAFIARNPVDRAWSGARMETAFDRGCDLRDVPVADHLDCLRLLRSRRYGDYAGQLDRWASVFGADRVRVFPFEMVEHDPVRLVAELCAHMNGTSAAPAPVSAEQVFAGAEMAAPDAVRALLLRDYLPRIAEFQEAVARVDPDPAWTLRADQWRHEAEAAPLAPEAGRSLLVISGFAPNPAAMSSGQKLAHRRITELAARFGTVRLVYFVNDLDRLDPMQADWPANVTQVQALPVTRADRICGMLRWPHLPGFVSARRWAARKVMPGLLTDPGITDFFADFAQGLAAVPPHRFDLFAFRQHDIVSHLYDRKADFARGPKALFYRFEAARTRRWQAKAWARALRTSTLSAEDAALIRAAAPQADVRADPVRGTIRLDPSARNAQVVVPGRLGFWGNMSRAENVDAARHAATVLLPAIRRIHPHAHLWIIGAHPTDQVRALTAQDVNVTGFVEDPLPVLATLDLAIAPLRLGSGVKIKVLETLDAGIPTVVSPVGGEGVPDHPLLHRAETDADFIAAVAALVSAPQG